MKTLINFLVFFAALTTVYCGKCNFPPRWGAGHWLLQKLFPVNNTRELITYKGEYAVISNSNEPDVNTGRFDCDAFETDDFHNFYIKEVMNDVESTRRYCVDDIQTDNVILHREVVHDENDGDATIAKCKTALDSVDVYDVYLPVAPLTNTGGTFEMPLSVDYPFNNRPYRVTYTPPDGTELCLDDSNSVLVVGGYYISILTCKYKLYYSLPLTGLLQAKAVIDPRILGETDDSNGYIMIVDWYSKSLAANRTFSLRAKQFKDNIMLSFDLHDDEAGSTLHIRKGARYDDGGTVAGRTYFQMDLKFDNNLVSRPMVSTTPRITVRPTPGASTTPAVPTIRPTSNNVHVQVTMIIEFRSITDMSETIESVKKGMFDLMDLTDRNRIINVRIVEGTNGLAVAMFDLKDGIPSIKISIANLQKRVKTGFTAILHQDGLIGLEKLSVYSFRDDDNCTTSQCINGGKCTVMQGDYSCSCLQNYTGTYCADEYVPVSGTSKNMIIYIAVGVVVAVLLIAAAIGIVIFLKKRNQTKGVESDSDTDSEAGYKNAVNMEDRDREIFSTINKKPKAFHEKSFSSLDKGSDYGERTGIHL